MRALQAAIRDRGHTRHAGHPADRTVDVHVKRLREKIKSCGLDPNIIGTVRGVGYRLAASAN